MFQRRTVIQVCVVLLAFTIALAHAQPATETHADVVHKLNNQAYEASRKRQFEQAIAHYRKALAVARETKDTQMQIATLAGIGANYTELGRYREALDYHQQAQALHTKDYFDHPGDVSLARAYQLTGDYPSAQPLFEHKYKLAMKEGEPGMVSGASTGYMEFLIVGGRYAQALEVAQRFQKYLISMGYKAGAEFESDTALIKLHHAVGSRGALPLALRNLRKLETADDESRRESPEFAETLYLVGESYRVNRDIAKARQFHQRALALREKLHPAGHPLRALSQQALARLADNLAPPTPATVQFTAAHRALLEQVTHRSLHPPLTVAERLAAQLKEHEADGNLAFKAKKFEEAIMHYRKGLALLERARGVGPYLSRPFHEGVAAALSQLKRYRDAAVELQRAASVYVKRDEADHLALADVYYKMGLARQAAGEREAALIAYQQAAAIGEKRLPNMLQTAESLRVLAALHDEMGEPAKALPIYKRALAIAERQLPRDDKAIVETRARVMTLDQAAGKSTK